MTRTKTEVCTKVQLDIVIENHRDAAEPNARERRLLLLGSHRVAFQRDQFLHQVGQVALVAIHAMPVEGLGFGELSLQDAVVIQRRGRARNGSLQYLKKNENNLSLPAVNPTR